MVETVFDLPTHVLVVHAPVVLIPLVAAATIVLAVRSDWRDRFTPQLLVATGVTLVTTLLAVRTGEGFDELVEGQLDVDAHESFGKTTRVYVVLWFLSVVALRVAVRQGAVRAMVLGLTAVAVVLASMSTYWVVRTGHEGARVTWETVVPDDR